MHIPQYYKKKSWQRFLFGVMIGSVIAYCVFSYMFNTMYERIQMQNQQLQSEVSDLKNQNDALLKTKENLSEQSKEKLMVESIHVAITNEESLKNHLVTNELEEMVKKELNDIIGQQVDIIAENDYLLTKTIENKEFTIDDVLYRFHVKKLVFAKELKIAVKVDVTVQT